MNIAQIPLQTVNAAAMILLLFEEIGGDVTKRKVAVVTGAGTGVGRASAEALLDAGFDVFAVGRRVEPLYQLKDASAANKGKIVVYQADIGDAGQVGALFEGISASYGRIDVLFNNAGIGAPAVGIDELDLADWRRVVSTNLDGAFYCAREAFGLMKTQYPRGGRIINNGSISAHMPRPYSAPYTVTKHAITGLTRSLSLDGRPFDIACSQIDIGNAATEMTERMREGVAQADGSIKPEPRMDVHHVAKAIIEIALLPLDVNVQFMTIMATKMPYIGRG